MTKSKSKKMTKSTFAIVIMAIVMVAMLAFGGTYAYFTANAVGEKVEGIKTAQLELLNMGDKITYDAENLEIVPGDYIFGAGYLNGETLWDGTHDYETVNLELGNTNAAVYAFVRVTTKAYTGEVANAATAKPLMVKTGTDTYAPVLKLIPREDEATHAENEGWKLFTGDQATQVGVDNSTYIFYFKVADNAEARTDFNTVDFDFSLQFDYRVHADRTQNTQGQAGTTETTNVYVEGETTTPVQIMNVSILFEMQFATIQQTGFKTPADAYVAAFKDLEDRTESDYTDNLKPVTP